MLCGLQARTLAPRPLHATLGMKQQIIVSVPDQRLRLSQNGEIIHEYPISTSKFGLGSEVGSFRTPLGQFRVKEKIGGQAEVGTIFQGRKPVAIHDLNGDAKCDEDMILTRILRLDGCELANQNTWDRFIYIHGTNDEVGIGRPNSHGCIRMRSADIVELYEAVADGCDVEIADYPLPMA